MARNQLVQLCLNAILEALPVLEQQFFKASIDRVHHQFSLEDGTSATFYKTGYTRSGLRNISYAIRIVLATGSEETLRIYVFNPSDDDLSVNMRGVRSGIEYLMSTGDTIRARDVDVSALQDA
ncbi:hypothetical protein C8Q70DRAFT_1054269 [Cubamyces menziesii]|nr:hypothetical protein C8Q70DRAFT_1054269 [Cubamyces menziesii]